MKTVTRYAAFDGQVFDSAADCLAHERGNAHLRLVGMTIEQLELAISGKDAELAEAIEAIGSRIARARRDSGEFRRRRLRKPAHKETPAQEAERLTREEADFHEGRDEPLPEDMEIDR